MWWSCVFVARLAYVVAYSRTSKKSRKNYQIKKKAQTSAEDNTTKQQSGLNKLFYFSLLVLIYK